MPPKLSVNANAPLRFAAHMFGRLRVYVPAAHSSHVAAARRAWGHSAHPAGTRPIRLRVMVPELPLELPPVKLKLNVAVEQL